MCEPTDKELMELAERGHEVTVTKNCYTNRAGKFWIGTIFYCKKTDNFYDADADKPFSADLRSMLLANIKAENSDV